MRIIQIPKKTGGHRTIYAPNEEEKRSLRALLPKLNRQAAALCPYAHGCMEGRNPATNALVHVGFQFSLSADLSDFFDSVTSKKVKNQLSKKELELCFVGGIARQGLPTSPAIANLAAAGMDRAIARKLTKELGKKGWAYSRYVDDLTISYDDADHQMIRAILEREIKRCGFRANEKKWSLQWAGAGRRVICGIAIDGDGSIHATREARRKLRAALHQDPTSRSAKGLQEWASCKVPTERSQEQKARWHEALTLARHLKVRKPRYLAKKAIPEIAEGDFRITHDPAYYLGMSLFTTGWKSCMNPLTSEHNYYRALPNWVEHSGTAVACLLSDRILSVGGVSRRVMRSRALVHVLRDSQNHSLAIPGVGVVVINRLYGDKESQELLQEWLKNQGAITTDEAKKAGFSGRKFVGHVRLTKIKPYLDLIAGWTATASSGQWEGQEVWGIKMK